MLLHRVADEGEPGRRQPPSGLLGGGGGREVGEVEEVDVPVVGEGQGHRKDLGHKLDLAKSDAMLR